MSLSSHNASVHASIHASIVSLSSIHASLPCVFISLSLRHSFFLHPCLFVSLSLGQSLFLYICLFISRSLSFPHSGSPFRFKVITIDTLPPLTHSLSLLSLSSPAHTLRSLFCADDFLCLRYNQSSRVRRSKLLISSV